MDVGRLRATVDQLTGEVTAAARQAGRLGGLPVIVGQLQQRVTTVEALASEVAHLSEVVEQLLGAGRGGGGEDEPPRPVDWTHVDVDERHEWLIELGSWVRDVLFVGWPHAAERLRPCWPRHREIINDLAALRTVYATAYDHPGGRAHHAIEYRRTLEDVLRAADSHTRECPPPGAAGHRVPLPPRDDAEQVGAAMRVDLIAEIHALAVQANNPHNPTDLRQAAQDRAQELFHTAGVTPEEYQQYERARAATQHESQPGN